MPRLQLVVSLLAAHALTTASVAQQPRVDAYGDRLPAGAIHRLGTLRVSPDGIPALSPDGKLLATSTDNGVQFWDAVSGKLVRSWAGHPWGTLAFSPDGQWLATGPFGVSHASWLHVYDAQSGKLKHTLHPKMGGPVAFSPDGKRIACGHWLSDLILYDAATGNVLHNLGTYKTTQCLAFSPDGRLLVAGYSADMHQQPGFVGVWECATGKRVCLITLKDAGRSYIGAVFQPDSRHLFVSAVRLVSYDIATGKEVRVIRKEGVRELAADRACKRAISGSGEIWDLDRLEVVARLEQPTYGTVAISADGKVAASSNPLRTWDVASGKTLFGPPGHGAPYLHAAFSSDDERIVTRQDNQRTVLVWDAKTGRPLDTIPPGDWKIWGGGGDLRFMNDGQLLVGWDLWDLRAKKRTATLHGPVPKNSFDRPFSKIEISPDGKTAVDWNDHEGTRLWDVRTCKVVHKLCGPVRNQEPYYSRYAFSPDSKTLAVAGGFVDEDPIQFRLVDVPSSKTLHKAAIDRPGTPRFSADGRWVFLSRHKPGVEVWHVESGKRFRTFDEGGWPFFSPYAVAPHGQLLVTTGFNGSNVAAPTANGLVLFEVATGQKVCTLPGHANDVTLVSFAHDGRRFISGSRDNTALVWSLDELASKLPEDDERLWSDLSADAAKAYPLLWALLHQPKRAVALAEKRLQRDPATDGIERWVADLGNTSFAKRSEATQRLRSLGMSAWPAVKAALERPTELEVRRRLEELLDTMLTQPHPDLLRDLRVIQMLETLGTPEARQTLVRVEKSASHGPRAEAARSAIERIGKRANVR